MGPKYSCHSVRPLVQYLNLQCWMHCISFTLIWTCLFPPLKWALFKSRDAVWFTVYNPDFPRPQQPTDKWGHNPFLLWILMIRCRTSKYRTCSFSKASPITMKHFWVPRDISHMLSNKFTPIVAMLLPQKTSEPLCLLASSSGPCNLRSWSWV